MAIQFLHERFPKLQGADDGRVLAFAQARR
jgi:hypothetical protein